ncbi:hypothetical protein CYMTET_4347 [Cymbomonas tetramitiformis]|uniref:Ubiquitin-like protease family profile domain-containing protein n=1 Tax=Cymbomonas tetramitiformis TaxID=36881 RepID=A0AAE0H1R6_9CHLO|nr:hypothetical protein CYMTET_47278 [Cymbomonas tetramitiformis]KAK3288165.1 hypothetical protein CYMTET_4347 [Cymbomonas tetramitiformis]
MANRIVRRAAREAPEDVVDLSGLATDKDRLGDRPRSKKRVEIGRLKKSVTALTRYDRKAILVRYSSPYSAGLEYTLHARHFYLILQRKWLDDTIMNAYYVLLSDKLHREKNHNLILLHTYVYSILSTKVLNTETDGLHVYFDKRARFYLCAVLVNGNHWISVLVDVVEAIAYVYDSLHLDSATYADKIMDGLRGILRVHRKIAGMTCVDPNALPIRYIEKAPKQKNNRDCGVYALAFAHAQVRAVHFCRVRMGADMESYGRENLAVALQRTHVQ